MVLLAGPRPNRATGESLGGWSCQAGPLGASLPSQNGSPQSRTISYPDGTAPTICFARGQMPNYCCSGKDQQGVYCSAILLTPVLLKFCSWIPFTCICGGFLCPYSYKLLM